MLQDNALWIALAAAAVVFFLTQRMGKIAPAEAHRLVAEGALLVDVRSLGEFSGGHLPGAINVPVDQIAARADELAQKGKPIVVYCASGMRSGSAARALKARGVAVHDLGGMSRW